MPGRAHLHEYKFRNSMLPIRMGSGLWQEAPRRATSWRESEWGRGDPSLKRHSMEGKERWAVLALTFPISWKTLVPGGPDGLIKYHYILKNLDKGMKLATTEISHQPGFPELNLEIYQVLQTHLKGVSVSDYSFSLRLLFSVFKCLLYTHVFSFSLSHFTINGQLHLTE